MAQLNGLDTDVAAWMPSTSFGVRGREHTSSLKHEILRAKRINNALQHKGQLAVVEDSLIIFEDTGHAADPIECKLFPEGRQTLIGRLGVFEIWSTETRERLWVAPLPEGNVFGSSADIDVTEDGETAMIACIYTPCNDTPSQR